jgi:rare lipoprotein A
VVQGKSCASRYATLKTAILAFVLACGAHPPGYEYGKASWYGIEQLRRNHGRSMSNGQKFDKRKWTAASDRYPLGTVVEVTNLENGRRIVVEITDRGPAARLGRLIDLSESAAQALGYRHDGITDVAVMVTKYRH